MKRTLQFVSNRDKGLYLIYTGLIYIHQYILYIFTLILIILVLLICFYRNITLDEEFSYFFLSHFFFSVFSQQYSLGIITIPFIALLFIPYLKEKEIISVSSKNHKKALTGLISVVLISMMCRNYFINGFIYKENIELIADQIITSILVIFMMYSLFSLKKKSIRKLKIFERISLNNQ